MRSVVAASAGRWNATWYRTDSRSFTDGFGGPHGAAGFGAPLGSGVQYAAQEYTNLLGQQGIRISMGRRGNPYDNAQAESFLKTLKYEEVYVYEYEDLAEARRRIGHFLEAVYNEKRLHSALGYVPPAEFERSQAQPQVA